LTRPSNFVPLDRKLDGRLKAGHGEKYMGACRFPG
jgi:hypothetical protein